MSHAYFFRRLIYLKGKVTERGKIDQSTFMYWFTSHMLASWGWARMKVGQNGSPTRVAGTHGLGLSFPVSQAC